jgi:hypothetical protein
VAPVSLRRLCWEARVGAIQGEVNQISLARIERCGAPLA